MATSVRCSVSKNREKCINQPQLQPNSLFWTQHSIAQLTVVFNSQLCSRYLDYHLQNNLEGVLAAYLCSAKLFFAQQKTWVTRGLVATIDCFVKSQLAFFNYLINHAAMTRDYFQKCCGYLFGHNLLAKTQSDISDTILSA